MNSIRSPYQFRLMLNRNNITEYHQEASSWDSSAIPGLNDLAIVIDGGYKAENDKTVDLATSIQGMPGRHIRSIRHQALDGVDELKFWELVRVAVDHLQELCIEAPFKVVQEDQADQLIAEQLISHQWSNNLSNVVYDLRLVCIYFRSG